VTITKVVVGLKKDILNILARHIPRLEEIVGPLDILEIIDALAHNSPGHFGPKVICELAGLLGALIESLGKHLSASILPCLLVPLVPDVLESFEVDRAPAHWARGARTGSLQIPVLDAARAEFVSTGQLAERAL